MSVPPSQLNRARFWVTGMGLLFLLLLAGCGEPAAERSERRASFPVRVAAVAMEPIEETRTFSGSLEARAEFIVAPKIGGRLLELTKDVSDVVQRGEVVARLDDAEAVQAFKSAEADVTVAMAYVTEALNNFKVARRELDRFQTLREREITSESQLDRTLATSLAAESAVAVAEAQLVQARSALETARIRREYTNVTVDWSDRFGDNARVVARRYVNEGDTVGAGDALLQIVELDPIMAAFFVTEREYPRLGQGQPVTLVADALPGVVFDGVVARVAPTFDRNSRQARIEVDIDNPESRLKPGMFVRVSVVLDRREASQVLPVEALTEREGRTGVFQLTEDGKAVRWVPVETGLRNVRSVEILAPTLSGHVVTLGQHLVVDGAPVHLPEGLPSAS